MKLTVIGSNSNGNGYVLHNGKETLIIEAGRPCHLAKRATNFNWSNVNVLITHEHGDHSKFVSQYLASGATIYMLFETWNNLKLVRHHRIKFLEYQKKIQVGSFAVIPFKTEHDVPSCGFFIDQESTGRFCFITDTLYSPYNFTGLNNMIVEANFCEETIGVTTKEKFLRERIYSSHLSLQKCIEFLKTNDLRKVNNIVLIHLSDRNADEKRFKREIERATGKKVTIAVSGITIDFSKNPF